MNPRLAHLSVRGNHLTLRAPYDPEFLADFKIIVPVSQRKWRADTKSWRIKDCHLKECCKPALIDLCSRHFDRVIIFDEDSKALPTPDWALLMFDAVPARLHQPLYRSVSKVLHPDHGGDLGSMQQLAAAYTEQAAA